MGTKVTYFKLGNFTALNIDGSGKDVTVFNLRDQIAAHPDYGSIEEMYNRIQVTAIAWKFYPTEYIQGTGSNVKFAPMAICYDATNATALASYVEAFEHEKVQYVSQNDTHPWYACKTQQAAYTIQDTAGFALATNQIGYIKCYGEGSTASTQRGYLDIIIHCYFYDRK